VRPDNDLLREVDECLRRQGCEQRVNGLLVQLLAAAFVVVLIIAAVHFQVIR
jgi:hypothetical protein